MLEAEGVGEILVRELGLETRNGGRAVALGGDDGAYGRTRNGPLPIAVVGEVTRTCRTRTCRCARRFVTRRCTTTAT